MFHRVGIYIYAFQYIDVKCYLSHGVGIYIYAFQYIDVKFSPLPLMLMSKAPLQQGLDHNNVDQGT